MTVIVKCNCRNDFQDEKYGKGMRVNNKTKKDGECRCTACSTINHYQEN